MSRPTASSDHITYCSDGGARIWDECIFELICTAAAASNRTVDQMRVLDVGCGNGNFLRMAGERGLNAVGVDFDPRCVENANLHGEAHLASSSDLADVFPANSFDLVLFSHSLEHFTRPRDVMLSAKKISRTWIIVAVPNAARLDHLVANALRNETANLGHCYSWDRAHLTVFLERRCGLTIRQWHTNHLTLARLPLSVAGSAVRQLRGGGRPAAPSSSGAQQHGPLRRWVERGLRAAEPLERRAARVFPFFANDLIVLAQVPSDETT